MTRNLVRVTVATYDGNADARKVEWFDKADDEFPRRHRRAKDNIDPHDRLNDSEAEAEMYFRMMSHPSCKD